MCKDPLQNQKVFLVDASRLYINYGCPWAHRANLVRSLKGLEDVIDIVVMSYKMSSEGW